MSKNNRTFALSFAVLLLLGAVAPSSANAWPLGKLLHLHPRADEGQDARITVHLFNRSDRFQEVSVAGQVYTVLPHYGLTIKAPAGTAVLAETTNVYHRKGEVLFSVTPNLKASTVSID